jgi:hypothetical protein
MRNGSSTTTLVPKFEHGNDGKDLPLGANRNGIPLLFREEVSRWVCGASKSLWPWENKVRLNNVTNESKHGNTAVLDLGLTEPSDGGFVTLGPKVLVSKGLKQRKKTDQLVSKLDSSTTKHNTA